MAAESSVGPGCGVTPDGDGGQGSIALSEPMREDSPAARIRPQRLGVPGILGKDNRGKWITSRKENRTRMGWGYFCAEAERGSSGAVDSVAAAACLPLWNQLMWGRARSAWRRTAIISATMVTAISAGVTAPMSRPTGEWT